MKTTFASDEESESSRDTGGNSSDSDEETGTHPSNTEDDDEEEQEEDNTDDPIGRRLADIPFAVLDRLKHSGRGPVGPEARAQAIAAKKVVFHRERKDRPMEMSSKRPVPRYREVIQVPKQASRDPRFENLSGKFSDVAFKKRYSFLFDEVLPGEVSQLKQAMTKASSLEDKQQLRSELTRMQNQLVEEKRRRKKEGMEKQWKEEQREAVKAGKPRYYLKKSEKRKRELLAQYEELKQSGRLEKFMTKRRKKNASKDHRYLPSVRREEA